MKHAVTWTLTFDLSHSESEDLLSSPLQEQLLHLRSSGAWERGLCVPRSAKQYHHLVGPVNTLVVPWSSELQQFKNRMGNEMLDFVLKCVKECLKADVVFWVENPFLSWLWRQVDGTTFWLIVE